MRDRRRARARESLEKGEKESLETSFSSKNEFLIREGEKSHQPIHGIILRSAEERPCRTSRCLFLTLTARAGFYGTAKVSSHTEI